MNAHVKPRQISNLRIILAGAGILGLLSAAGITYAVHSGGSGAGHQAAAESDTRTGATSTIPASVSAPALPALSSITPATGASNIATNAAITLNFSAPVNPAAPQPAISPAVLGTWTTTGSTMTFTPAAGWIPSSKVTVTLPGRQQATTTFTIGTGSPLRLQQILALLGYLPVTFTPAGTTAADALADQPANSAAISTSPVDGTFSWAYPNTPASLAAQWNPNANTVVTKGAVMAFEADHGLATDGIAGPAVWNALLAALAAHSPATHAYSYLMVSESQPETLQVWSRGAIVASSLANTGAPGAATALGTYPVFEHLASTTMIGTNPDGTKYNDPDVKYVAYFNGGDAVHEYPRTSYGWPQSNGCVELPSSSAATVWGYDPIGTLVTVS